MKIMNFFTGGNMSENHIEAAPAFQHPATRQQFLESNSANFTCDDEGSLLTLKRIHTYQGTECPQFLLEVLPMTQEIATGPVRVNIQNVSDVPNYVVLLVQTQSSELNVESDVVLRRFTPSAVNDVSMEVSNKVCEILNLWAPVLQPKQD